MQLDIIPEESGWFVLWTTGCCSCVSGVCIICLCTQYRELQASLTRQAADWIAEKKQQAKGEREQKWRKVRC